MIFKKKVFKKHDFEEKNVFKKQILKKVLHTKNHVLIQFTPWNAQILRFTYTFKKHDFDEIFFKARFWRKSFF